MTYILEYNPGQQVTVVLQTLDSNGTRVDGYSTPIVNRIIMPNLTLSPVYPVVMSRLDTGLYIHTFTLPSGASSVGTYIVDIFWTDATTMKTKNEIYQVIVKAPSGQFSASPA